MNRGVLAGLGPGDSPDVLAGDAGQNAVLVAGNRKEVAFSTTTAQAVATTDCSDYRYVSVHIVSQGTNSTVNFQGSNDNVNWLTLNLAQVYTANVTAVGSSTIAQIYAGALPFRYFRLNVTGISAGTTSGVVELFAMPGPPAVQSVNVGTTVTVQGNNLNNTDGIANSGTTVQVASFPYGLTSLTTWDRLRVPNIFKTATATASGDTALWTPTSGKKFRLMRYQIQITGDASTSGGGVIDILLRDATTSIAVGYSLYVPATAVSALGADNSEWIDLGNGFLSALANNVLNVNLSAALATGKVRVVVCGTEE